MIDKDGKIDTYLRSKIGIGLPPSGPGPRSLQEDTLTDNTEMMSVDNGLISSNMNSNNEQYYEEVLHEMGEDLDHILDCIDDYRGLLKKASKKE